MGKDPDTGETVVRRWTKCNVCKSTMRVTTNNINFAQLQNGEWTGLKCPVCNNNGELR